ncbi:SKA complex subunit 1 homolog [Silene latifolia]|uniref:SKA complex subunit 1 homolog n=1 Tax=Silene latifolia TaxID=37657 RepID=UPI003D775EAF
MEAEEAGASLESLMLSFNTRISQLQELIIARNMYPASSIADLSAVDAAVKVMELQVQSIKARLREETLAIPKAKRLIEASLKQQKKLQEMSVHVPSNFAYTISSSGSDANDNLKAGHSRDDLGFGSMKIEEEPIALPKEKKGRGPPPLWYITADELGSLSSYMRGRLTLEKVNAAISDMATYAEANAHLITSAKKKLPESMWERALELRDIATTEGVKGKHFFLESDMKGPSLKLDNTGKAILTVLRHLGRISETRVGHNRVIILSKPH